MVSNMRDEIHDCLRHIIICLPDRVFDTCAIPKLSFRKRSLGWDLSTTFPYGLKSLEPYREHIIMIGLGDVAKGKTHYGYWLVWLRAGEMAAERRTFMKCGGD